jgi:hypothetical protein
VLPIVGGDVGAGGVDEIRERIRQAEFGRPDGTLRRRAEQPDLGPCAAAGELPQPCESMAGRQAVPLVGEQLRQLVRKIVRRGLAHVALEREGREGIAAGRTPDREIDAVAVQAAEHAEVLGDLQRAVVRQHHAAAADADTRRRRPDRGDQHFRAGAGQHRRAVVLGHPVPVVADVLRESRQIDRVSQRVTARRTVRNRGLVEDTQPQGHCHQGPPIAHLTTCAPNRDTRTVRLHRWLTFLTGTPFAIPNSIVKITAPPPTICQKCGSHRTRVVGQSPAPKLVYVRCEACGHGFVPPPPQA